MTSFALPPQTLAGKVAIVTGSSRGIGAACALDLAKRGAKVKNARWKALRPPPSTTRGYNLHLPIIDCQSRRSLSAIAGLGIASAGAVAVCGDLRNLETPKVIVDATLAAFGSHIDILVNNAAVELNKPMRETTAEEFSHVYDVNVRAVHLLTAAVVPHLRAPGRIINISSVGARAGFANLATYCSSKAALEGLTRCWAAELGADGTTVNAVASGPVQSTMLDNIPKMIVDSQKQNTPVEKRVGTAEEIAAVVSWLAGSDSAWVSGQTLSASGGWAMY